MKSGTSKTYLGQIIKSDGKIKLKIKSHADKAFGNVDKIQNSLVERP